MSLKKIGTLKEGRVNTVCVCTDNESDEWHTLWEVKRHKTARMLMDMHGASPFAECGMDGERLCILLAYEEPRPLGRFYQGSLYTWEERRRIHRPGMCECGCAISSAVPASWREVHQYTPGRQHVLHILHTA